MTSSQVPPAGFSPQAQVPTGTGFSAEKPINMEGYPSTVEPIPTTSSFGFLQPVANLWSSFHQHRQNLGLPNPGTIESLQREVKSLYLAFFFNHCLIAIVRKRWRALPSISLAAPLFPSSNHYPSPLLSFPSLNSDSIDLSFRRRSKSRPNQNHFHQPTFQLHSFLLFGSKGSSSLLELQWNLWRRETFHAGWTGRSIECQYESS